MAKPPKLSKRQKEFIKQEAERNLSKPCVACNGTGYYDDTNSPNCTSCDGTGKS
jgi:DnaJ-class molecular chaperone